MAPSFGVSGWVPAPWVPGHRLAHLKGGEALGVLGGRQSCSERRDTVTVTPVSGSEHMADSPQGGCAYPSCLEGWGLEPRLSSGGWGGARCGLMPGASRSFAGCGGRLRASPPDSTGETQKSGQVGLPGPRQLCPPSLQSPPHGLEALVWSLELSL